MSQSEYLQEMSPQQLAAELARSEQRRKIYEAALSSTPDLVYVFDLNHRFVYANEALLAIWGRSWDEAIGKTCLELGYPDWHAALHQREIEQVIATRASVKGVVPFQGTNGRRMYEYVFVPVFNATGEVELIAGTNTDVTEQRRLTEEREALLTSERATRAEVERISRMKDEFLATLSHELRTPLNAILGYATLMRTMELTGADLEEAIATIERNARLQAQLIDDLLDMNRIISGKIRLDMQQVDLVDVLDEAVAAVKPSAEARGITLMRIVQPDVGAVRGDPSRLQQVIWNLLTNAIKFTPQGGHVHLSLERGESEVEIAVSDTGQGIETEFLPHVFDRFRQADSSTTRRHGGLGLGLSIVRQLVELHGGSIEVTSPGVGQGATFVVRLPISSGPEQAADERVATRRPPEPELKSSMSQLRGVRVLVVDDEPDATALVKRLLERCGAEVERAGSAAEAMKLLSVHCFDIIVSDIGMPGEDGYQFIRRVRSLQNPHRDVPAVALTAFARVEDRKKAAQAGFQTHLSKPVEAAELVAVVDRLARREGSA